MKSPTHCAASWVWRGLCASLCMCCGDWTSCTRTASFTATSSRPTYKRTNSFKLCDWIGEEEEKVRVEQTGRPVGTPVFLAPEVARSPHRHCGEGKSDIWGLGCTVLNLVTGRLPWEGTDAHGRTNEFMVMFKTAYGHAPPMVTPYDPREPDQPLAHFLGLCLEPAATKRPRASALL